ncbi:hypothetical protein AWM68_17810 [Fictibacillus phosphorivorans]|uniref:HTH merR-type domain-containing protein n=1 Tax=Fictibacillus phosphorivorans TaxID=1221500 RepID=A0A161RUT4_9BACL|nr:MerR family transcriptional regulator [Fictibacillus phosphorivorans]KZE68026.1 hypothetical protein AWM68_17810 [Fictibacillus phosphorivorans]
MELENFNSTEVIYTIKEVAERVGVSTNTIRNWEKEMQDVLVINRDTNQNRYYTEEDIQNFNKIDELKGEGLQFQAIRKIFSTFKSSVRTQQPNNYPTIHEKGTQVTLEQIEESNKKLVENLLMIFENRFQQLENSTKLLTDGDTVNEQFKQVSKEISNLKQILRENKSPEQERRERLEQTLTTKRVETKLKKLALEKWNQKPADEKTKRVGLFRTEEDTQKREDFIRDYIDEHFESEIKKQYDL